MASFQKNSSASKQEKVWWKSKSLLAAAVIMLVGIVMWVVEPAGNKPASGQRSPDGSPLATGFVESQTPVSASGAKPSLQPDSPALFRLGGSYIVGFFIGWGIRKSLKMAFWFAALIVAGGLAAQYFGLFHVDLEALQDHFARSLAWLKGESGAIKEFLTGYIPSSAAGIVGMIVGATRK
jgi:uncharacterized membrane protein (Fun14 family)